MPAMLASGICMSGVLRISFNSATVKSALPSLSNLAAAAAVAPDPVAPAADAAADAAAAEDRPHPLYG